ncbi:MAG: primosomal protein N' [Pseudomonadota bacterium]
MPVLRLAIRSPLRRLFDYLPPADMSDEHVLRLKPGQRLRVSFGTRSLIGYLVCVAETSELPETKLKRALTLVDEEPLVPATLVELCVWAVDYYQYPPGEVFSAAFPKTMREGRANKPQGLSAWSLTDRGLGLPEGALSRSPKQSKALDMLRCEEAISNPELIERGISQSIMRELEKKGLVKKCLMALPVPDFTPSPALEPTSEQASVLRALIAHSKGFSCHLLQGVTGSGKTEVYLQLIANCLQRNKQALVLIPEIGLTPQTLTRFKSRFAANIVVVHSGLTDRERYLAWDAARVGSAHIVIGTRSAIFTPLKALGVIIVDEEHDSSYKQQDGFRYSARDMAVKRGQIENAQVLLGSATPSLESLYNASRGRYSLHRLTRRPGGSQPPNISVIDIRRSELQAGMSEGLIAAINETLSRGQQVLVFLNRRGFAPTLQCHSCGWIAECQHCDARMTVHQRPASLQCHHCGANATLVHRCPQCHSGDLITHGLGTEQTETYLQQRFPDWPVYRVDSDSMQGKHAMQALNESIAGGKPCILLGTQMLTKGHHFPGVTLVAIIDVDALLFSTDFRGEERMAQLLTQVAGRAGRAQLPGQVLLQTHYPDHPLVKSMLTLDYAEQARHMLDNRLSSGMPPAGQLLIVRTDSEDPLEGERFLIELQRKVRIGMSDKAQLIGPLPSPMQRRAGKFRHQLIALLASRRDAKALAETMVKEAELGKSSSKLKWSIDVDPMDLY